MSWGWLMSKLSNDKQPCSELRAQYKFGIWYKCRSLAKYLVGGAWYCGMHNPEMVKARKEKRYARANAKHNAYMERFRENERRRKTDHSLLEFARWVIREHRSELGDVDGGSIQEKLIELGILHEVTVTEPCGENCRCSEYWDEFPNQCLRLIEGVNGKVTE